MARKSKSARTDGRLEKKIKVIIDGVEVRKSVYGYDQLELASNIKKYQEQCALANNPFFKDVAENWKEEHFKTISYGTQVCYNPAYKTAMKEFEKIKITEIQPIDIKDLLEDLKSRGYSAKVVKTQKTVLNQIFNYGIVEMKIQDLHNPVQSVTLPKNLPSTKRNLPSDKEIKTIIANVNSEFGLLPYFLLFTGCRRGEALAIQWKDINFKTKAISVSKIIAYEDNKSVLHHRTKTSAGVREIFLLDSLCDILIEYKKKIKAKSDDYIFAFDPKTPYTPSQFRTQWDNYCKRIEIKVTPHQLRHAYATVLFEAGVDEKSAQYLMGHSDIALTRDIYTHIRQVKKDKEKKALNKYVNKELIG